MAEHIGQYKITVSNGSARNKQKSSLRVYRGVEVVAVMHRPPMGSILDRIRKHPKSEERQEFVNQLLESGIPPKDIELILTTQGKKLGRDGKMVERRKDVSIEQVGA